MSTLLEIKENCENNPYGDFTGKEVYLIIEYLEKILKFCKHDSMCVAWSSVPGANSFCTCGISDLLQSDVF